MLTCPPETVEGWYMLHQIVSVKRDGLRVLPADSMAAMKEGSLAALRALMAQGSNKVGADGWTTAVSLIGSRADLMIVHARSTIDEIGCAQQHLAREPLFDYLAPVYSFLSVAEAPLYGATVRAARDAVARGGEVGDAEYKTAMIDRAREERGAPHIHGRLYPPLPESMPYVCFYPMSKRRDAGQNWYALPLEERSHLMQAHGVTGRRYAGRVQQIISGAIGFDAWEWGVTLFARDPLEFKKVVTEMRYDEVSAKYAEFGEFFVGKIVTAEEWVARIA
ncbi:MAG: hydrogen peroxide-dependent heme synthase [Gemmatimonadaceae bacterium]